MAAKSAYRHKKKQVSRFHSYRKPSGGSVRIRIKTILITQQKPESEKNPYSDLARKHKILVDFVPFIHLEGVEAREFRKLKINPSHFNSIILTSRNTIDHFFKLCDDLRIEMSVDARYFCMSESIALYLQKYILYRKRKVFFGDGSFNGFTSILDKYHIKDKYLIPCADNHRIDIASHLRSKKYNFREATIFRTVPVKLKEKEVRKYDMIVFFTPNGVQSLTANFPKFSQRHICIGAFGPLTSQAIENAGLHIEVQAPAPAAPSMAMALDQYLSGC